MAGAARKGGSTIVKNYLAYAHKEIKGTTNLPCNREAINVGSIVKQGRIYLANRTIHGLHDALGTLNAICKGIIEGGATYGRLRNLEHAISSVNSYLGFTVHCNAYNLRLRAFAKMSPAFWQVCFVKRSTMACVKIRRNYRVKIFLLKQELYGMALWK